MDCVSKTPLPGVPVELKKVSGKTWRCQALSPTKVAATVHCSASAPPELRSIKCRSMLIFALILYQKLNWVEPLKFLAGTLLNPAQCPKGKAASWVSFQQ